MTAGRRAAAAADDLFAYGTLMFEEILLDVAGLTCTGSGARLRGYRRRCIRGEVYPGIAPEPGACVSGLLYRGMPPPAWERLDRFEGPMYERVRVAVELEDGARVSAMTYVVRPDFADRLAAADWDPASFLRSGRASFESGYGGYRRLRR